MIVGTAIIARIIAALSELASGKPEGICATRHDNNSENPGSTESPDLDDRLETGNREWAAPKSAHNNHRTAITHTSNSDPQWRRAEFGWLGWPSFPPRNSASR
jgi:hypothetical protein